VSKLEENVNEFFIGIDKVMKLIPKDGTSGHFPCPVCGKGTVKWVRVAYNRHLRIGCSTPECIMMMQ
jgi:predicted RNA-binding Zn-ribbon protein involved in translation (DUF1610 family)